MVDQLVQKVITAYADFDGLTRDECKSLGLNKEQGIALSEAFADGFISVDERDKLTSLGFSSEFIVGVDGDSALRERVKWLADKALSDPDEDRRYDAVRGLRTIGPAVKEIVPALFAMFRDPKLGVRDNAARIFGEIGPAAKDAVPALIALLGDPDQKVRYHAAQALGEIGPAAKDAVPALIALLKDPDQEVRKEAAWALGEIGPAAKDAVPDLIALFRNKNQSLIVRDNAARALGEIGPGAKDAVPVLIAALRDPNEGVRAAAALTLGKIGSSPKDIVPALIAALKDPARDVRNNAAYALGNIGPAAEDAVPALIELLKDPEGFVRSAAAWALGEIGSAAEDAVPALNAARKDPDEDVRYKARQAPGKIYSAFKKVDIDAAEESIGAKGALLLRQKFGIERFNRYHPSILKHLVKMAADVNYDRHKPLILALVAAYDDSGVFYWGRRFKYDPRIRLVVIEANNRDDFRNRAWEMRNTYGIPDEVFITAHGTWDSIMLGKTRLTNGEIAEDFKGFFGDKKGHVLINACDAGAPPPKGKKNFAQMTAHGFNAETTAARAVEGLLGLRVKITDEGQARLVPTYFEVGAEFFGFNYGGMTFYPNKKPEYKRVVDTNIGWQPGVSLSYANDWRFGGSIGYGVQRGNRFRLRADLSADLNLNQREDRVFLNPEAAVGLTNHLMFAMGAMGGVAIEPYEKIQPFIQEYAAFKLVVPSINTELDLGAIANWNNPSFFAKLQSRF